MNPISEWMESRRLAHEVQADERRLVADGATTNEIADSAYGGVHMTSDNLKQFDEIIDDRSTFVRTECEKTLIEKIHEKNMTNLERLKEFRRREETA